MRCLTGILIAALFVSRCACFEPFSILSTYTTHCSSCTRGFNRCASLATEGANQGCFGVLPKGESSAGNGMITLRRRRRVRSDVQMKLDEREKDAKRDAAFERELERDAAAWVNGNPGRQKLWDRAQKWIKFNKLRRIREEALAELERDKLRYVLKDVQAVTGLPLLNGQEITPLAWFITLSIQLMPLAAFYLVFTALVVDNPEPVLDMSKPFWAGGVS